MSYWLVKIKIWLLYLFLFLLPFQTRLILRQGELNGYWEYGTYSIYFIEILLWLVAALSVIGWLAQKEFPISNFQFPTKFQIPKFNFFYLIGILLFIIVISSLRASAPSLSFYWLLHFFEGLAMFLIIRHGAVDWKKLSAAFIAGAVLQSGLAIWQFAAQSVFASQWLGMAAQDPSILGTSVVEAAGGRFLRAYGALPHPNILGAYLLLALLFCILSLREVPHMHVGDDEAIPSFPVSRTGLPRSAAIAASLAMTASCLLLVIGIFFTFSRAAWLGLLISLIIVLRGVIRSWTKMSGRTFLSSFFIFLSVIIILNVIFWPLVQARLTSGERLEIKSNIERLNGYQEAWQIIKNHPWLGVGLGNYTLALYQINLQRRSTPDVDSFDIGSRSTSRPSWAYQPIHNVYLLALAELGVVGFIALMVAIVFLLKIIWQKSWQRMCGEFCAAAQNSPHCLLLLTSLFFILAFLFLFDHFFWSLPFGMWLFWSIMGLSFKISSDYVRTSFA